jgi:zinc transport system substrate-binding protein
MSFAKCLSAAIFTFVFALAATVAEAGRALVAYTSVGPVANVMTRVGAGRWQVRSIVEEGKDPHAFAMTPKTAAELASANVYVAVGMEMDPAVRMRAPDSLHIVEVPEPPVTTTEGKPSPVDAEADDHDPHLWLDPDGLLSIARASYAAFVAADPDHGTDYTAALKKFENEMGMADARAAKLLSNYRNRRFYVQHDAFTRFAKHYRLAQVAVEEHEKEPTGSRLAEVARLMQKDGARTLFAQPGHNPRPLEVIAKPVGAKIGTLDPLLPDPVEGLVIDAQKLADNFKAERGGEVR